MNETPTHPYELRCANCNRFLAEARFPDQRYLTAIFRCRCEGCTPDLL